MELKAIIVIFILTITFQIILGQSIPEWCRRKRPRLCKANYCDVEKCKHYPEAICINDNPCKPTCKGHFYTVEGVRLSRRQCKKGRGKRPRIPAWCPKGSPTKNCFVFPCDVMTCPAYQQAICIPDNPCEPACSGNFYLGRQLLNQTQCHEG
ncbi:uncharacterized protein LOC123531615 [Mercenaria mercenaria]|uniref:uncharacterized protein LOC123531615 n=1 Tax=Mercenaria mercenaria TaxID=6596 RepID=UPI001E1DC88B|nr:uncharacterized protein LOC123531615 [Mercenaria mercenaria]